nr:hypothetical protein [uncultured Pseudomonas sp.]
MTPKTETTRHVLYQRLAILKAQKKMTRLLSEFESAMEDHLEALRKEHESLVMISAATQNDVDVYRDAYENQKTLTRNACVYDRERWDELYQLRDELESVKNDRQEGHDKLQEATAKLARQTQTIIALHRVIKDQQKARARSQRGMEEAIEICAMVKAEAAAQEKESHRQIMAAEALSDDRWEKLQDAQSLIKRQREAVESLSFQLVSALFKAEKPSFWRFLWQKKAQ